MPEITSLNEFRIELQAAMREAKVCKLLEPMDLMIFELRVSSLALDYAAGFARTVIRDTVKGA